MESYVYGEAGDGTDIDIATADRSAGLDTFVIDSAMITALQSAYGAGGNSGQLARIDGGSGLDTISLSGTGLALGLSQVANPAGANPDGGSRIDSVEKINLTGSGNNTLILKAQDVRDMAGFNGFETTGANAGRHQLLVTGNAGDSVDLADGAGTAGWTQGADVTLNSVVYDVWNHTSLATMYVTNGMSVI